MAAKGQPKTGGRKKGTPNKFNSTLTEMLDERFPDYDPVLAMAEIARDPDVDLAIRVQCHKEVAQYKHPKLRSTEIKGTVGVANITVGKLPGD